MQIALKTLGCRLNEAELEAWSQQFQASGHQITGSVEQADLIVLNTCAVTQDAVRKSRQLIRRFRRDNPRAKLVVSGCYASLNEAEIAAQLEVDHVVSNQNKDTLPRLIDQHYGNVASKSPDASDKEPALFRLGRQRAFIKVQDGCRYHCTFCIVTVARGDESSRTPETIIDEINQLTRQGIKEVALTGVHLGGYHGQSGLGLANLIEMILAETDIDRLRLGSLEPWDIPENFYEQFANPRLMPHLHLPLQSGSDPVLKRMGRRCSTREFAALSRRLKTEIPDMNITTDIIVGFPGETEQDWQQTLAYVSEQAFSHIHIFSYSPREGTAAARFSEQLPNTLKKNRSQQLHQLAGQLKLNALRKQIGKTLPILVEGDSSRTDVRLGGYTPNYLRVEIPEGKTDLINRIIEVEITAVDSDQQTLTGQP